MRMLPLLLVLLAPAACSAELRTIAVKVDADPKTEAARVTIHSEAKEDQRFGVSAKEAAATLKKAQGWGSAVFVVVVVDRVPLRDCLPVLEGIAANPWLTLVGVRTHAHWPDQILKHYGIEDPAEAKERAP